MTPPSNATTAPSITTLSRREVYRNHWMRVYEDQILRSNGQPGIYGVVEKDDSAIIIPIDGDRLWLVEQYRYTIAERALEFPQGGWERSVANPEDLARGELKEEIGIHAARMIPLGPTWIAYGFTRQLQHVYLALDLSETETNPDSEEHDLVRHSVSIADFEQMIRDGVIRDQCTLAAWAQYLLWQKTQK